MATERNMLDALNQHLVYSNRASTKVVNDIQALFTKESTSIVKAIRDVLDELTEQEVKLLMMGRYSTDSLKELKSLFASWYEFNAKTLPASMVESNLAIADYESKYIGSLYGESVALNAQKVVAATAAVPIVEGRTISVMWDVVAKAIDQKAKDVVIQGVSDGLTNKQILDGLMGIRTRMPNGKYEYVGGVMNSKLTRSQIESNVRTIRNKIAQTAYEETFIALGFEYVKDVATLDGRTSDICKGRDGKVQKVTELTKKPPYHFNCRTVQVGCDKDGKIDGKRPFVADTRSVKNIPKAEREDIIGQVDANTSYPEWFKNQSATFQKEVLGPTKYALYKKGGFTFDKFVDPLGKPYTISELRELDRKTFKELGL